MRYVFPFRVVSHRIRRAIWYRLVILHYILTCCILGCPAWEGLSFVIKLITSFFYDCHIAWGTPASVYQIHPIKTAAISPHSAIPLLPSPSFLVRSHHHLFYQHGALALSFGLYKTWLL